MAMKSEARSRNVNLTIEQPSDEIQVFDYAARLEKQSFYGF